MAEIILRIRSENKIYEPLIKEDIKWETVRFGSPGKLTFTVIKDELISFFEGDPVLLYYDETPVFFGFVFQKQRSDENHIEVTAYDQLRYLKNKDSVAYINRRADEVIRILARNFQMQCGELENTGYIIAERAEENKSLFDIIGNALDITTIHTGNLFVLYDDFGKLTLRNMAYMKKNFCVTNENCQKFSYTSSIDSDTYNVVKLQSEVEIKQEDDKNSDKSTKKEKTSEENKDSDKDSEKNKKSKKQKKTVHYTAESKETIAKWGMLQLFEKKDNANAQIAKDILDYYNRPSRKLSVSGITGDFGIRAGCLIPVFLSIGDMVLSNYMFAEKVVHKFGGSSHTMDIDFSGRDIDV